MRYQYKLHLNGQTYERYEETTARNYKVWKFPSTGITMYQIAFGESEEAFPTNILRLTYTPVDHQSFRPGWTLTWDTMLWL